MYDLVKDLPLLVKQKIYDYLSHTKYDSKAYIFLKTQQYEEYDATFFSCGLISSKLAKIIEDYSSNQIIEYIYMHRYSQNQTLIIDKIIYDPKEIETLVKILGKRYHSSKYDLIEKILDYIFYDDIQKYGSNSDGEPTRLIDYDSDSDLFSQENEQDQEDLENQEI